MTRQQRIWKICATVIYAVRPLLLYALLPGVLGLLGQSIRHFQNGEADFWAESGNFYAVLGTILVALVLHKTAERRGSTVMEETTFFLKDQDRKLCGLCVGFGLCLSIALSVLMTFLHLNGYNNLSESVFTRNDLPLAILSVVFFGPVMEEVLFRGYMINRLLTFFDEKHAVIISSAVFACCHVHPVWMLYAFCMGLFLGRLAVRKDNILYPVCVHFGFNLSVVLNLILRAAGIQELGLLRQGILLAGFALTAVLTGRIIWLTALKKETIS